MLSFEQAFTIIREKVAGAIPRPAAEIVELRMARGRILAEEITADRDYPPFNRSTRDGFAVRSSEVNPSPVVLQRAGELRAGENFEGHAAAGQCVQIMTGAPLPEEFDAVVMIEHVRVEGSKVEIDRAARPWENVVRRGSEAAAGSQILTWGRRLGPGEIGLLASVGKAQVSVFAKPRIAIIPTGDEIVPVEQTPKWFQIRNSNAEMLAAQVEAAGGVAAVQTTAADLKDALRETILKSLEADLLILSGGVSMGKYDLVKQVLEELSAEFFFHGLAIRPGKPLLFGRARGKFFFGLPGNPVSSHVTFELFARPVVEALGGAALDPPVFLRARLSKAMKHKNGLTTFLPARVEMAQGEARASVVGWQGSGDLVGVAQANCFLVLHPEQEQLEAGDWVDILPKEK